VCPEWAGEKRDRLIADMAENYGVKLLIANRPAYLARQCLRDCTPGQSLPLSEELGERLFCVPIHPCMSDDDNERISAGLIECIERLRNR
jgi:dTDP-4-amino-4,6-dideoxygalactose transaminase